MKLPVYFVLVFMSCATGAVFPENPRGVHETVAPDGEYIGRQPMPNVSPDEPDARWFHEDRLVIRDNEAILDMVPIWILHGRRFFSASDGGFLTYRGRFFRRNGQNFISLRLFQADYIMVPVGKDIYSEVKTYPVSFAGGTITINGVRYRPKVLDKAKAARLVELLRNVPLERQK